MKKQRHRQRRNNTALARSPHLYHLTYGCDVGGHLENCFGRGMSKKAAQILVHRAKEPGFFDSLMNKMKSMKAKKK